MANIKIVIDCWCGFTSLGYALRPWLGFYRIFDMLLLVLVFSPSYLLDVAKNLRSPLVMLKEL